MTLWKTATAQNIWLENWCCQCYRMKTPCAECATPEQCRAAQYNCGHLELKQPGCPILDRALRTRRKPVEWDRNTARNRLIQAAYRCNEFHDHPPRVKSKGFVDVPMIDMDDLPGPPWVTYVPIDGDWPEKPTKDTDHA